MKLFSTIILTLFTFLATSQNYKSLVEFNRNDSIVAGQAVIYGSFIQRLGFSSGGFAQDVRIINMETNEISAFRVKPAYKSAKENTFCYSITPGTYAIYNYWWTQSKWYGAKFFTEPIFKNIDSRENLDVKIKSGQLKQEDLTPFVFTINPNSLNYLGTWHFDTGVVKFSNDKLILDNKLKDKYKFIEFSKATTLLPN
ncbi:hypothetical protein RCH18_001954 [Flavobacterium sp. PL11]|jgi:hypothetical protein|uniref:hypothetical protein n=1 Tax=Flavobacterium sp. PL11 TaxID=3071717 RepID=UPI002E0A8BBE|nr:hypothetical protein [Flavobacterium sp. PL11]